MPTQPADIATRASFNLREVLRFCLPALIVGAILRLVLTYEMPLAFYISDTHEFIGPAKRMIVKHENPFQTSSRTFLGKVVCAIPLLFKQPGLAWIAAIQHLIGLGAVFAAGVLCRLWMTRWRVWIIPLTLIIAVHPTILWYEHMALPDSTFIAMVLFVAATGGLYYQNPSRLRLGVFAFFLFLAAGSRQEGFLFLPFGLALVLLRHWGELRAVRWRIALICVILAAAMLGSRTTQGGQMLLTSTVHMAPDKLWFTKDFSEAAVELREHFKPLWPVYPNEHNKSRKIIVARVNKYLLEQKGIPETEISKWNNKICKRVAMEIALRNWWRLPPMVFHKFLATHREPPSPDFGESWLHDKQLRIMFGGHVDEDELPKDSKYMALYFGRDFKSREEFAAMLEKMYPVGNPDLLSKFQHGFVRWTVGCALPDRVIQGQPVFGLSFLYILGYVGLLSAAAKGKPLGGYRWLWILTLSGEAFMIFLTGSLRSRYRLIYEPWWFLGVFCLLDTALLLIGNTWKAKRTPVTEKPELSQQAT